MQFDLDIHSPQAELFYYLRSIILSFDHIYEVKNAKQTSYKDRYSTVCMMRVRQNSVRISFANGATMAQQFSSLQGSAKIVRYVEFGSVKEINEPVLKEMLSESLLLNMEKFERASLKRYL